MPPQKEKLSQDGLGLKKLMESFSITFEGPVPPARWPPLYRHHFSVIRDIWSTRYDDYMDRTDINTQRKAKQQRRVVKIRENAYKLRGDLSINESTWRHQVEPNVVKIFEKRVIWFVEMSFSRHHKSNNIRPVPFVEMNNMYQTKRLFRTILLQGKLWRRKEDQGNNVIVKD